MFRLIRFEYQFRFFPSTAEILLDNTQTGSKNLSTTHPLISHERYARFHLEHPFLSPLCPANALKRCSCAILSRPNNRNV